MARIEQLVTSPPSNLSAPDGEREREREDVHLHLHFPPPFFRKLLLLLQFLSRLWKIVEILIKKRSFVI